MDAPTKDVSSTIRNYIARHLLHDSNADLGSDRRLLEDGIVDSFGLQQLLTFLEQEFGVVVDDEHLHPGHFDSVDAITLLVSDLMVNDFSAERVK